MTHAPSPTAAATPTAAANRVRLVCLQCSMGPLLRAARAMGRPWPRLQTLSLWESHCENLPPGEALPALLNCWPAGGCPLRRINGSGVVHDAHTLACLAHACPRLEELNLSYWLEGGPAEVALLSRLGALTGLQASSYALDRMPSPELEQAMQNLASLARLWVGEPTDMEMEEEIDRLRERLGRAVPRLEVVDMWQPGWD